MAAVVVVVGFSLILIFFKKDSAVRNRVGNLLHAPGYLSLPLFFFFAFPQHPGPQAEQ